MNSISLSELTGRIQQIIKLNFDTPLWIRAEISELRENPNGHCYLEFIEKEENSDSLTAKTKGIIWSSAYRMIKPYFENATGESLRAGIKVLVAVTVEFNGQYGFSLVVRDIDPTFTIGETAARRLKIIRQLEADGIADMNKQLELPKLVQRIAIISSATAAGYGDFIDQMQQNTSGLVFYTHLFPAIMQGDQAESSIIAALDKVYNNIQLFDIVVIIRGGGAVTDLACFDSYNLAINCAQFPLPILVGIGHQRDNTILDLVAFRSLKTPTAVAEFLIQRLQLADNELFSTYNTILSNVNQKVNNEKQQLINIRWKLKQALKAKTTTRLISLNRQINRLKSAIHKNIAVQNNKLLIQEKTIEVHSPSFLLKHGYTITTVNGRKITSVHTLKTGDKIKTYLHDGSFESTIQQKNN